VADKCRDIQGYWSKGTLTVYKGYTAIRDMWRIYMDNEEDRLSLLVQGLVLRGRQIPLHSQNPYNPGRTQPDTIRIKVKNDWVF
jgi:hypothetical protein